MAGKVAPSQEDRPAGRAVFLARGKAAKRTISRVACKGHWPAGCQQRAPNGNRPRMNAPLGASDNDRGGQWDEAKPTRCRNGATRRSQWPARKSRRHLASEQGTGDNQRAR